MIIVVAAAVVAAVVAIAVIRSVGRSSAGKQTDH